MNARGNDPKAFASKPWLFEGSEEAAVEDPTVSPTGIRVARSLGHKVSPRPPSPILRGRFALRRGTSGLGSMGNPPNVESLWAGWEVLRRESPAGS